MPLLNLTYEELLMVESGLIRHRETLPAENPDRITIQNLLWSIRKKKRKQRDD